MSSYQVRHVESGRIIRLKHLVTTIGRKVQTCDIVVDEMAVSRRHCLLSYRGLDLVLSDLGSRNGTAVNGVRVQERVLRVGDEIAVGTATFVVEFWVRKLSTHFENDPDIVSSDGQTPQAVSVVKSSRSVLALDSEERWFVRVFNVELGPLALPELAMRCQRGELQVSDLVRPAHPGLGSSTQWLSLQEILPPTESSLEPERATVQPLAPIDKDKAAAATSPSPEVLGTSPTPTPISTSRPQFVVRSDRRRQPVNPSLSMVWQQGSHMVREWLHDHRQRVRPLVVAMVVLMGGYLAASWPTERADRRAFERVFAELQTKRASLTSAAAWNEFEKRSTAEVQAVVTRLQDSATAKTPARRALLFAGRDYLMVMLQNGDHRRAVLCTTAEDRERRFRRCLDTAGGIASPVEHVPSEILANTTLNATDSVISGTNIPIRSPGQSTPSLASVSRAPHFAIHQP